MLIYKPPYNLQRTPPTFTTVVDQDRGANIYGIAIAFMTFATCYDDIGRHLSAFSANAAVSRPLITDFEL